MNNYIMIITLNGKKTIVKIKVNLLMIIIIKKFFFNKIINVISN
jgi:hypothetical protein